MSVRSYEEVIREVYALERRGIKLELGRVREAMASFVPAIMAKPAIRRRRRARGRFGPRIVHVAGTNGKGSVCALVESALRAQGYRTGLFTSPHLHRFAERMRINGRPAGRRALAKVGSRVLDQLEGAQALPPLSFFETGLAMALAAFEEAEVDVIVLEVGLGGRLDATNVVTPDVTVITGVAMDHARLLGNTVQKIAKEKAGILKPGVPLVSGTTGAAKRVVERRASRLGVRARFLHDDFVAYEGKVGLRGAHQRDNAAVAREALRCLRSRSFPISDTAIERGFSRAKWPARIEYVRDKRGARWLLDAAHNPQACESLAEHLRDAHGANPPVLLFGSMEDKEHRAMLGTLAGAVKRIVYAPVPMPRSAPPSRLVRLKKGELAQSVPQAMARARRLAGKHGVVVVAGSIFLVANVRARLLNLEQDPPIRM